jgi:hypothetical protein
MNKPGLYWLTVHGIDGTHKVDAELRVDKNGELLWYILDKNFSQAGFTESHLRAFDPDLVIEKRPE